MKKRIYIAYTGGTIDMKASEKGYIPEKEHLAKAINNIADFHHPHMPEFTINEYTRVLSRCGISA